MPRKVLDWSFVHMMLILLCILCLILFVATVVLAVMLHNEVSQKRHKLDLKKLMYKSKEHSERLPRHVVPKNYNLVLWPHLAKNTFSGAVTISVKVIKNIDKIIFHASTQLNISEVTVKRKENAIATLYNVIPDDSDLLTLNLPDVIVPDYYVIEVKYSADLKTNDVGLYDVNFNNGKTMVTSKFEPTYARQAFPCFDEPDFKATFDVTLVIPDSYIALSNMNELSRLHDNATHTTHVTFARSVLMSTYLLCFAICDFDYKETVINTNGIGKDFFLRSYAQRQYVRKLNFAQDIGKRALEFFIDYYKLSFPLPKLDMIAIPNFDAAMEHWGLASFNEDYLLFDDATDSADKKFKIAGAIAHELAHMWFGNLVTMKWWDDLWLNEGFAQYMQYKCLSILEPSWNMMDVFLPEVSHVALKKDAQKSSHPIVQGVQPSDDIMSNFDEITYHKGASILRMLDEFIGQEPFRQGVNDYLKKFQFKNTVTQDLVNSLELYSMENNVALNLTYILGTWTQQAGYPVLQVKTTDNPNIYNVTQSRFLSDPEASRGKNCKFCYRWFIPVTYTTNQGPNQNIVWFSDTVDSVKITLEEDDEWFKLNNNQVGFYRVNYEAATWNKLIDELRSKSKLLSVSDRAHLIDDVFALASAGLISYSVALDLLTYLPVESHLAPWEAAHIAMQELDIRLKLSNVHSELKKYIQHLIKPLYTQLKWNAPTNNVTDSVFREKILVLTTSFSLPEAISEVSSIFQQWLQNYATHEFVRIDPELRSYVFEFGAQSATEEQWDKLWHIYLIHRDLQSITALASSTNTDLLRKMLQLALEDKDMPLSDLKNIFRKICDNPSGTALIWDYVRANWRELVERFTSRFPLTKTVRGVITSCNTEVKLKEMEDFFEQYPFEPGDPRPSSALETCKTNIKWTKHHAATVSQWLKDYLKLL